VSISSPFLRSSGRENSADVPSTFSFQLGDQERIRGGRAAQNSACDRNGKVVKLLPLFSLSLSLSLHSTSTALLLPHLLTSLLLFRPHFPSLVSRANAAEQSIEDRDSKIIRLERQVSNLEKDLREKEGELDRVGNDLDQEKESVKRSRNSSVSSSFSLLSLSLSSRPSSLLRYLFTLPPTR